MKSSSLLYAILFALFLSIYLNQNSDRTAHSDDAWFSFTSSESDTEIELTPTDEDATANMGMDTSENSTDDTRLLKNSYVVVGDNVVTAN